ncbi:uncharacterized protein (DUF924 family) [Pseudomonas sp. SJZ079]|uniref:DUF924 family protein n=1 Tax=Pseudomonas sp. SJZ079 TaxID=2572887 RepID=UPI001199671E|nr:DUF924 family protein [Pseudomonas sp. SJZ079]TWC41479.1 uncharacterized protein (DUF924 family) [Pseudomonas sp. SJZ079]
MTQPWQPLLDWWFGAATTASEVAAARNTLWFGKQDSQDSEAQARFAELVEQALAGELDAWHVHAEGWLANVLLLDQLPRMIFRDSPRAFAGDLQAQALVREGLRYGWDIQLTPIQRVFVYIVFEHAEDLEQQERALACFTELHEQAAAAERQLFAGYLDYAERHQRVIARFARFPHRNSILGRASTPDELAFLREPGSGF